MISRVAESAFWMMRYLERAENTARLLDVNRSLVVDAARPELARWRPMVVCSGEEPRFLELVGPDLIDDAEAVQSYLVWDRRCPASILNSLYWARENARTIRETLSPELWLAINEGWLWLRSDRTHSLYERDRFTFFMRIVEAGWRIHGVWAETMLHEEPHDFCELGRLLERAGCTARLLDVHHHAMAHPGSSREPPERTALWLAVLRTCSAREAFFLKSQRPLSGHDVVAFLLREPRHPRSVLYSLTRMAACLDRIRATPENPIGEFSRTRIAAVVAMLARPGTTEIHELLTRVIDACALLGEQIHADYFAPLMVPEV